jgi:twitching motility protein PilT
VLISTGYVRECIITPEKTRAIKEALAAGTSQYGMQTFDQSLMQWFSQKVISYESAMFYASSPAEFALRTQGIAGTSDTSWSSFEKK